jgi:hypothetical protein
LAPPSFQAIRFLLGAVWKATRDKSATRVWKGKDGQRWYVAVISKATIDREGELVTERAMDFSISLARKFKLHSGLHVQHVVPQTRIGQSVFETRVGPYWIEIGRFRDDLWLADKMFERLRKDEEGLCKLSVGFVTPQRQARRGVYTRILKYDTSIVDNPACPQTKILVGGKRMSEQIENLLKLLGPQEGEEEKFRAALTELIGVDKSVETVEKQEDKEHPLMARLAKLFGKMDDEYQEEAKKCMGELKAMFYPEEEDKPMPKKKDVEPEALAGLQEQIAGLTDVISKMQQRFDDSTQELSGQIKSIEEQVEDNETQKALAAAFTQLVKRMPDEALHTQPPSQKAEIVQADSVDEVLKALGASELPAHPFSDFAGAPRDVEGGRRVQ